MKKVPVSINRQKLPGNLSLVLIDLPDRRSLASFLVLQSGSRYETKSTNGLAHFFEHIAFKGTRKFSDTEALARQIEGSGGYFNAWTANDHTCYWNTVPANQWQNGVEIALELAFFPLIREADVDRERGVIIEEIRRINDDPASLVDDLLGGALFPNHPLGWSVAGNEENIRQIPQAEFVNYHRSHYLPNRAVLALVGPVKDLPVADFVRSVLGEKWSNTKQDFLALANQNREVIIRQKKTDQTHLMLGMALPDLALTGDQRSTAAMLNMILGQGMASRLFMAIREKLGLAYAVHSSFHQFQDTGLVAIYAGLNNTKIDQAVETLDSELEKLIKEPVGQKELDNARSALLGALEIAADQPLDLARWYGVSWLLGAQSTIEEEAKNLEAVTIEQIQELAGTLLVRKNRGLAVVGDYPDKKRFFRLVG